MYYSVYPDNLEQKHKMFYFGFFYESGGLSANVSIIIHFVSVQDQCGSPDIVPNRVEERKWCYGN